MSVLLIDADEKITDRSNRSVGHASQMARRGGIFQVQGRGAASPLIAVHRNGNAVEPRHRVLVPSEALPGDSMNEPPPDLRDVLESIARDLENRAGNSTYQQAYKKAARLVRSYQKCKLYVPIQTDGTSQNQAQP